MKETTKEFLDGLLSRLSIDGGKPTFSVEELLFNLLLAYVGYMSTSAVINKLSPGIENDVNVFIPFKKYGAIRAVKNK